MLKKSTTLKISLILLLAILFLLILGGNVNADTNRKWGIKKDGYGINSEAFISSLDVGGVYSGEQENVKWKATVIKKNKSNESGDVILEITEVGEGVTEIYLPDQIYWKRLGLEYTFDVRGISGIKNAANVTKIHISKYIKVFDDNIEKYKNKDMDNEETYFNGQFFKNFTDLNNLKEISISEENGSFATENGALYNHDKTCLLQFPKGKDLTNFEMPKTVNTIGEYAFYDNQTENVNLEISNTITTIKNNAFQNAKLKGVVIPDSVTDMGNYVFVNCSNMEVAKLSNKLTEVPNSTFKMCENLTTIELPDSIKKIGDSAFSECNSLRTIVLPDSIETIGNGAFSSCSSLDTMYNKSAILATNTNGIFLPDSITNIGKLAFGGCTSIKRVKLPKSLNKIEYGAFWSCYILQNIELSDSIETIEDMAFHNCKNLKSIKLSKALKSIKSFAFSNSGLTDIEIPTNTTNIYNGAFSKCSDLKNVVLSNYVTNIGADAFEECDKNLVIYCYKCTEDWVKKINANATIIPAYILCEGMDSDEDGIEDYIKITKFSQGSTCTEVKLLKEVYNLPIKELGKASFKGNDKLQKIKLTNNVTTLGDEVFAECKSLNNIVLPKTITAIPNNAFENCESLSKIVIRKGSALTSIGTYPFKGCANGLIVYHDGENSKIVEYANGKNYFRKDNTRPTANISTRTNDNKSSVTITLSNIKDNEGGSGVYYYAITQNNNPEEIKESEWQEITSNDISKEISRNGTYYIYISDMVGNMEDPSKVNVKTIDETAPQIAEKYEVTYSRNGASISINATEEANGSGLSSYAFSKETNVEYVKEWKTGISGYKYEIKDVILENGIWYLYVKDNAGNISQARKIEITKVDKEKPTVGDITIDYNSNKYAEITAEIADKGGSYLGAYAIDLSATITDKTKWTPIEGEIEKFTIKQTIEANGKYYIHVKDKFENETTVEIKEITGLEDKIAPRVVIGERTNDKVKITITDAFSGIASGAKIEYEWTSNATVPTTFKSIELKYENGAKEHSFEIDIPKNVEGRYYLWINIKELKDVKGNQTTNGLVNKSGNVFELDSKSPSIISYEAVPSVLRNGVKSLITIKLSETIDKKENNINPSINNNTLAGIEGLAYDKNNNVWLLTLVGRSGNGEAQITLPKGIFKDSVGNTMESDYIIKIQVDNIAPNLPDKVTIDKNLIKKDQETTFTFTSEEKLNLKNDKIKDIVVIDKNDSSKVLGTIKENGIKSSVDGKTWTITVIGGSNDGDAVLKLPEGSFTDDAGNASTAKTYEGLKVDSTAPILTVEIPQNTIINKDKTAIFTIKSNEAVEKNQGNIEIKSVDASNQISGTVEVTKKDEEGKEWQIKVTKCIGDGTAKLVIPAGYFIDKAGNVCSFTEKEGFKVKNSVPKFSISGPTLNQNKDKAIVTITLETLEDGLKYCFKKTGEQELKSVENKVITNDFSENGIYHFYLVDSLGNSVDKEIKIDCIPDKTAPKVVGDVKYEVVDGGIKATITVDKQIQAVDGWTSSNGGTTISKVFNETTNTEIEIKDLAGNKTKVPVSVKLITSITLNKTNLTLEEGARQKLVVTFNPSDATIKDVQFKSGNSSIATVDSSGNITAVKVGETKITATTVQGSKVAECTIKVTAKTPSEEKLSVKLKNGSKYKMDDLYIEKINPKTTIKAVVDDIETNGILKIYKGTKEITDKNQNAATGMKVKVTKGTEAKEYTIVVIGDTNQDGIVNTIDIFQINKHRLGKVLLTGVSLKAADANGDKSVDIYDILMINKLRRLK